MSTPGLTNNYKLLRDAIKKKDKVAARYLIQRNVNVNVSNARENTLLHWAIIKFKDLEIMTMLLDRGANIHAKNHDNHEPIEVAIRNNKTNAAQLLMRRGALVREKIYIFLFMAIKKNNDTMVKMLIDHRMQNNTLNDLQFFLQMAISQGQPKIIEHILPHCQFLTPSDQYIPREAVIYPGPKYKECLELLLKWNFTVNPYSSYDEDFIYAAAEEGYLPIILQLLEHGIDVNLINPCTGLNLLKIACFNSHHEIVENLLMHNANVNVTCLHIAVLNSDLEMTKLLLRYGAMIIDGRDLFYITGIAVYNNCEEIVRIFLARGVNVADIDSQGKSLLHSCVLPTDDGPDSRYNIAKLLLDQGATIHLQTPGNSLLFEAVENEHRQTAKLFLEHNADIQYIGPDGNTLLHEAIENHCDLEFIKSLLELHLPVNTVNNKMHTPLLVACKHYFENPLENIEALLDYNANVNCADNELMTPLHYACRARNLKIATVLLKRGANPNATNNKGQTPLHLPCKQMYNNDTVGIADLRIIQLLLQHNANIEAVDERGWTPLFVACETGNLGVLLLLLSKHVNANHTDYENLTPLYIAAKNCKENSKIVKILLKHKVNVHCMDKCGNSVIHVIVNQKNAELIKSLAHTQVNFNSVNKARDTPLHIAVHEESFKMTKELIKYGANVNILDKLNRTPLKVAVQNVSFYRNKLDDYHNYRFYWEDRSWRYSDDENINIAIYESQIHLYKQITEILKIQVIKLTVAGLKVNYLNWKIVYNPDENEIGADEFFNRDYSHYMHTATNILQFEVKCEQEIERTKMESIGVNNITFHDLLTRNIHFLCRLVKNKKIRQALELEVYDEKFPLYMDIVRNRFRDAKFRYRMMESAKKYFISNVTQRLSDDCIDTIFSYLNIKDLKMFIRAMKPLNV